jgi:uncharacterized protein HemX
MNDWIRSIVAPVVVAVVVGMGTSYLSTQAALAHVVSQVQRHESEIADLRKSAEAVARLDERMKAMQAQLDRIERAVEGRK